MKLLYITSLPFYPDSAGGADLSYLYLFKKLIERGWQIEVISGLSARSPYRQSLRRLRRQALARFRKAPRFVPDDVNGYPCWRGIHSRPHVRCFAFRLVRKALKLFPHTAARANKFRACAPGGSGIVCEAELASARQCLDQRLREFDPDAVIGSFGITSLLRHAASSGFPSFQYVRGGTNMKGLVYPDEVYLIANSPYVASLLQESNPDKVCVILPGVEREKYRVEKRERRYITFINPIPDKGLDVVVEVARRLPQERFLFVKGGWFDYNNHFINKARMRSIYSLPNAEVWDFQHDMRRVYSVTDILLVPSRRESFGRIILEAHINGIPVIASNVGSIPFTLGEGGLLIAPRDDPKAESLDYIEALRRLRADERLYEEIQSLAFQNSLRPEFDCDRQVETFIRFVEERVSRQPVHEIVFKGEHSHE